MGRQVVEDQGVDVVLDGAALRALGEVSTTYARNTADITDRNNIQYHWIEIESVPAIWERLEAAGLSTLEACGDSPRPFLGSPVAGIAKDEIIDGSEALEEIKRRALGNPAFRARCSSTYSGLKSPLAPA